MPSTRRRAGSTQHPPASAAPDAPGAPAARPAPLASLRDGGRPLLLLLFAALVLKVLTVFAALDADPLAQFPTSDARYYLDRALGLAGVRHDALASEPYHLPPLYPWLLHALPGIAQEDPTFALLLQAAAGTLLLALVFVLARRRVSRTAALLAVALTLLYGPLGFYETRLLGDSLACLVLIALLVAADALADALSARGAAAAATATATAAATDASSGAGVMARATLLGALLGLAALLRPQALLLVPVLAAWAAWRAARAAGRSPGARGRAAVLLASLVAGTAALVLLPAAAHNLRASGDLILVSDNGGVNFWLANTGPPSGTFATNDEAFGDIDRQAAVARAIAQRESRSALTPGAVSSWFLGAGLRAIAADPLAFGGRLVLRARALLESFETDIASFPETESALVPPLRALLLPFGVLAGLCAAGLVLAWRPAHGRGPPAAPAPLLPLLSVAGMVVLTALLFFHYSRFRLPLVPLLALGAAAGWERLRAGELPAARKAVAALLLLAVVAVSYMSAPHHAPTRANGLASVGNARLALAHPGDTAAAEQADRDAHAALREQPGFARAQLLAARTGLLLGHYEDCLAQLDSLEARLPGYPPARLNRAFLHALRDPRNPYHDAEAARAIADELSRSAADEPAIAPGLAQLRAMLGR